MANGDGDHDVDADVLIVGGGVCGMALANLLGAYDVSAIVVERDSEIVACPRAIGIDDEALRICQTMGLVDDVLADLLQNTPTRCFTSWGRRFAHLKPSDKPFGWPSHNMFLQPMLERTLRNAARNLAEITLDYGVEMIAFSQDEYGVTASVRPKTTGQATSSVAATQLRARYLVGADGERSTVRQQLGVPLTGPVGGARWLVVDVANDQLDAPYGAIYCHPETPTLMSPLPYRHRRFEFQLVEGQSEQEALSSAHIFALLAPHYGATPLPDIVGARVYTHHAQVAADFQRGRVFLVGDAAHLQPPSLSHSGLNSGLRDVANLAWKLAAVVRGDAGDRLLSTYDMERRPHAQRVVKLAAKLESRYRPKSEGVEQLRDLVLRAAKLVPGGRERLLQTTQRSPQRHLSGVVTGVMRGSKTDPVGAMFPQPEVERFGRRLKLDDAIGTWFAVLCLGDPQRLDQASLQWWRSIGAVIVEIRPSRAGWRGADPLREDRVLLDDAAGAFRDWKLARPEDEVIILRPDRYLAGTCTASTFPSITSSLRATMR